MTRAILLTVLLTVGVITAAPAIAHKPSDSYLTLTVDGSEIQGRWDIALRDLDYAIGLDGNDDGAITWGELRRRDDAVAALAFSHLRIASGGKACPLVPGRRLVDEHSDGAYAVLRFSAGCGGVIQALDVTYSLFFDLDPQHRGLIKVEHAGGTATSVLAPNDNRLRLDLREASAWTGFFDYVRDGVWHIWIGFDHILFLIALLLAAVVRYRDRRWQPVGSIGDAVREVFKIVTAFTIAHSMTLSLAALGVIELPSRLVESVIAASIVVAALNNVFPVVRKRIWVLAFTFGLVHGIGFANVLADLGLPRETLVASLIAFNLGVEFGQLAIVSGFLPLAFLIRGWRRYPSVVVQFGSLALAAVGSAWLVERAMGVKIAIF